MDAPTTSGRGISVGLLAEVLLSGAVLAVLSLPLVTVVPALAAGAAHLRGHLAGEPDSVAGLLRRFVAAVRTLWAPGLALPALLLVLAFDSWLARTGALPGGGLVLAVSVAVALLAVVVVLRLAGAWCPGGAVRAALGAAVRATVLDPVGTVLLLAAAVVVAVVVWMLLPLMLIAPGMLALAAVGVEARRVRAIDRTA